MKLRKLNLRKLTTALLLSAFVFGALILSVHSAYAEAWGLPDLMQMLHEEKNRKATYVEKKYIAALQQPLEASGELSFTAPDRLEKRTLKPKKESVVLEGDKLTLERSNGRKMTLSLSERPEVSGFVKSIRATLSGDRTALEHFYEVKVEGSAENWHLSLVPKQTDMLKIISEIRIAGAQAAIKTIEFLQADGDRSEMTITPEIVQEPVTAGSENSQ